MNLEKYTNNVHFPNREDFYLITFGAVGKVMRQFKITEFASRIAADAELSISPLASSISVGMTRAKLLAVLKERGFSASAEFDEAAYRDQQKAYHHREASLYRQFKKDLIDEMNISDLPEGMTDKIIAYAEQEGHSSGKSGIVDVMGDIIDLMQPLIDEWRVLSNK
ncbi:hypothetical protein D3C87_466060 [compost metagenome]